MTNEVETRKRERERDQCDCRCVHHCCLSSQFHHHISSWQEYTQHRHTGTDQHHTTTTTTTTTCRLLSHTHLHSLHCRCRRRRCRLFCTLNDILLNVIFAFHCNFHQSNFYTLWAGKWNCYLMPNLFRCINWHQKLLQSGNLCLSYSQ